MSRSGSVIVTAAEDEPRTLFDELAGGLVPKARQAEYYRVIAHTRTLSPNDEMLRILEAMGGALALLTRETPTEDVAAERSLIRGDSGNSRQRKPVQSRGESSSTQRALNRGSLKLREGIGNRARPASHCEVARRKPSTVISAFRSARRHEGAWVSPVPN